MGGPPAGAPPPAFMQEQQKPKQVDVTKDPFAPQLGKEMQRPSLLGEQRPSQEAISAADQKAATKRTAIYTVVIALLCIGVGFAIGTILGNGCSQRKLRKLAVQDGNDLYGYIQDGSKKLADMKKQITAAQSKASKMEYDPAAIKALDEHTKKDNPPPIGLSEIAKRNYQIYTGETVPVLFTYANSWQQLYALTRTHVARSENDSDALENWKGKFETLAKNHYGIVFQTSDFGENKAVVGNLVLVTSPFDPAQEEYQIQYDEGTPVSEDLNPKVYMVGSGDLSAEPESWIMPLGDMSKLRLEEKAKKRFESYGQRMTEILELIQSMEKNQQFLINQLGTIAAEM